MKLTVLCQQLYPKSLQTWRPSCDYGQNSPTNRPQWPQRWWWAVSLILHWPTIALDASLWSSWQLPGRLRRCESTRRQGGRRGWSASQPRHHLLRHGLRLNPWSRPDPVRVAAGTCWSQGSCGARDGEGGRARAWNPLQKNKSEIRRSSYLVDLTAKNLHSN